MFRPLLGHHQVNLQNIKKEALFIQRAETWREYRSYLIKTLSIVAEQKVLLFTVNITRNRMQNPIIKLISFIEDLSILIQSSAHLLGGTQVRYPTRG
jgi:hypothetical protein